MYTSFTIENFRLFDHLTVEPLARVNLIAGENNAGKTALLEALWLLNHPASPRQALRISSWREATDYSRGSFYADIFHRYDTDLVIRMQAVDSQIPGVETLKISRQYRAQQPLFDISVESESELGEVDIGDLDFEHEIEFDYSTGNGTSSHANVWLESESKLGRSRPMLRESGRLRAIPSHPCVFQNSTDRWNTRALTASFGKAEIEGTLKVITEVVQLLEPRLKRLTTIADYRGFPSVYADIGVGRLYPLSIMGDGTKRVLALCLAFLRAQRGVLLVDEIENGLHYSVLVDVWKNLDLLSREFDVQVVATTHSYECIVAANNAFTELESDELHLHHLYRRNGSETPRATTYTKDMLETNIEFQWELR